MNNSTGSLPSHQKHHPRRPPAYKSVSLRHGPPASGIPLKAQASYQCQTGAVNSSNAPVNDKASLPSCTSYKVKSNKHSPGEGSDGEKGFESHKNPARSNSSFANNDPLFSLGDSSASDTPPGGHVLHDRSYHQASMMYRPSKARFGADGSGTMEEFRSIIDDLTVLNKKLKQKLKRYEKLHDNHLQDGKLFEVRFHGLSDYKKRELEEILQQFAANTERSPKTEHSVISSRPLPLKPQKGASSCASYFAESGYDSISASCQNSTSTPAGQAMNHKGDHQGMARLQYNRQQQNIQSYLDGIPINLLPKNHVPMTDESKKKLVVRRLEQIFTGTQSAPGSYLQPMQQEEVAQSAAMDDLRVREDTGQRSKSGGSREAPIIPARADDVTLQSTPNVLQELSPILHSHEHEFTSSRSPDQRPTRPLDLDLYREQVPAENIEYIRHLGFLQPGGIHRELPQDVHGWLYLNLLINMAQLHTLNVTTNFVKDAITEYSSNFELSPDGQKIRWRDNLGVTRSNDDSSTAYQRGGPHYEVNVNSKSPSKRPKISSSYTTDSNISSEQETRQISNTQKKRDQNEFTYVPPFSQREYSDDRKDFHGFWVGSSSDQPNHVLQAGASSGLRGLATSSSLSKRRDDGLMIFYSKAKFWTDLTGDRHDHSNAIPGFYTSIASSSVRAPIPEQHHIRSSISGIGELRGPFGSSVLNIDSMESRQESSSDEEMDFSLNALQDANGTEPLDTIEFEASGLGGVRLEDNFSIHVRRSRLQIAPSCTWPTRRKPRPYSKKILDALNERLSPEAETSPPRQQSVIKEEILSVSHQLLPSSTLPPPSFLRFDSTSSGDVDSDLESDVSSRPSTTSTSEKVPATNAYVE